MNRRHLNIPRDASDLPRNDASIHSSVPFLEFQTSFENVTKFCQISEQEFSKGKRVTTTHDTCLQCLDTEIDTFQEMDNGWAIAWHCAKCGYMKQSKEQLIHILKGVNANKLAPSKIAKYKECSFSWVEMHPLEEDAIINIKHMYQYAACIAVRQRVDANLREVLGGVDFFGYPGIFDTFARGFLEEQRDWTFTATKLQGVILLNHEIERRHYIHANEQRENQVKHYKIVRHDLHAASGKATSFSVLADYTLGKDGEPMRRTKGGNKRNLKFHKTYELGRVLMMHLTGVNRINHTYTNGKTEKCTLERMDIDKELEKRSWNFLAETLSLIRECLHNDGEYCIITLRPSNQGDNRGVFTVENKGAFDPICLREDFRKEFNL